MAESWKCPACGSWIGAMQVHEDCTRKQNEKQRKDAFPEPRSEWLRNVLEHCDRATSTSLATMRALGKDSTKIRKAVGR